MTDEMKLKVQFLIETKVDEAIEQDWIEDTIHLSEFSGWMSEAANLSGEEGLLDVWKDYDKELALDFYCWILEMKEAIKGYEWDIAHQKVYIKK